MKRILLAAALGAALLAPIPSFAHVNIAVGLGLGYPPPVYYAPPPPVVYAPAPTYYGPPPPVYYDQPTVIYQSRPYWRHYDGDHEWREHRDWRHEDHHWREHGDDD